MTIIELLAAKKAAANPTQTLCKPYVEVADPMLEAAINRIDPPSLGKRRAAGLVLSIKTPPPSAEVTEKAHHAALRSLSRSEGEAIPMTPCNADKEVATWHEALNAFESSLCVMRDRMDSDVVWLAVRPDRRDLPPILLCRLPWTLWDYPTAPTEDQPY
jgi:hypothetical protein